MGEKIAPLQRLQAKRADKAIVIGQRTNLLARIDRLRTDLAGNIAMHTAEIPVLDQKIRDGIVAATEDHHYTVSVGQWEVGQVRRLLERGDIFEGENRGIMERGLARREAELQALMERGETDPIIKQGREILLQRDAKPLQEEPAQEKTVAPLPSTRVRRFEPVSGEESAALGTEKTKSVEMAKPEEVKKEPRILYVHMDSQTVILKYEAGALRVQFNKDDHWGFVKELISRSDSGAERDALKRLAEDLHITSRYPVGDTIDEIRMRFKYFDKVLADIITRTESGGYRLDAIPQYIEDRKAFEALADNLEADKIRRRKPQAQKAEPATKPAVAIPKPAEPSPAVPEAPADRQREEQRERWIAAQRVYTVTFPDGVTESIKGSLTRDILELALQAIRENRQISVNELKAIASDFVGALRRARPLLESHGYTIEQVVLKKEQLRGQKGAYEVKEIPKELREARGEVTEEQLAQQEPAPLPLPPQAEWTLPVAPAVSPAPAAITPKERERIQYEPGPEEMLTEEEKLVVRAVVNALKRDHIWPKGIEEEVVAGLQTQPGRHVQERRYTSDEVFRIFESGYRKMDEKQAHSPRLLKYWTKDDLMLWERIHGTDSVSRIVDQLPADHAIRTLWQEIIDEHDNQKIGGLMVDLQTQTSKQFLNKMIRKIKEGFVFYDRRKEND